MNSKVLIGGLVAGVALFLLGWLIYGIILGAYMKEHTSQLAVIADEANWRWWAMVLANFSWGFMIAVVLQWSNTRGFAQGMKRGFVVALLIALGYDLGFYSMTNMFYGLQAVMVDVAATSIMMAIAAGIVGVILGSGKKAEATT